MQPTFTRFNNAIRYTLEYYDIRLIKDYFMLFAGATTSQGEQGLKEWYDLILTLHTKMEDEINQVIFTTNSNTQVEFFELLKAWLLDPRIYQINVDLILQTINTYNDRVTLEFENKVQKNAEEHVIKSAKYAHLEEYEEEVRLGSFFALMNKYDGPPITVKEKRINYRYYCADITHEILDASFIDKYRPIIGGILRNFNNILVKYVQRYESNKIFPNATLIASEAQNRNSKYLLEDMVKPAAPKLKTTLSVTQLAYLFKMLLETKQITVNTNAELFRFISKNFSTKGKPEGDISTDALNNKFNSPDNDTIKYWIDELLKMLQTSRKSL